jgi:cyclopropane-fatty-acyl-phospholipid synthase
VERADLETKIENNLTLQLHYLKSRMINMQSRHKAYEVGQKHYDLGNDLYEIMLDKRMNYTCGYWKNAGSLDEAQEAKLELICKKIDLEPGMEVLELGCGFGAFAGYAAEKYDVRVTGYTVSKEQVKWGNEKYKDLPVRLILEDYRAATGLYDRVISVGLMEHVGYKNYRKYMELTKRTLKKDGIAFFHTIGRNESVTAVDPWTNKYIFPNGIVPSISQLGKAMEQLFVLEDLHNFGPDYDLTLMAWYDNFVRSWPDLKEKYGERFKRMWEYYLLTSAGAFRSRKLQLWQVVMTRPGPPHPNRIC